MFNCRLPNFKGCCTLKIKIKKVRAVKIVENVHKEFVPRHMDVEVDVDGAPRARFDFDHSNN